MTSDKSGCASCRFLRIADILPCAETTTAASGCALFLVVGVGLSMFSDQARKKAGIRQILHGGSGAAMIHADPTRTRARSVGQVDIGIGLLVVPRQLVDCLLAT